MKKILVTLLSCFIAIAAIAQDGRSKNEKIEHLKAQKIAFLTEKIGLSAAEAQRFWPVYNEFEGKRDSLQFLREKARIELKQGMTKLSDEEKTVLLDRQMSLKWEQERLERIYHKEFKKILEIDKVINLYIAEHEFRMRLIRQIKDVKADILEENKKPVS